MLTDTRMIVRNKQGRMVGYIDNHAFTKEVYGSKHLLRKPAAWAVDADIFDRVIAPLCYSIHIIDKEGGRKYACGINTFREHCQTLDRKFNKQYYLELIYWNVN